MKEREQSKFLPSPRHALDFAWMRLLRQKFNALLNGEIKDENGNRIGEVKYADGNTVWVVKTSSEGSQLKMYRLKSVQGDYITCREWDGTSEGTEDVSIAKHPEIRKPSTATLRGTAFTYTYADDQTRTSRRNSDNNTITEWVIPPLEVNDLIFAADVDHTGVNGPDSTELKRIFFSPRAWARVT
jgi:hypothetical protein